MRRAGVGAVLTAAAVLLVGGGATAALQAGGDGALVDRLVDLEQQLPALPPEPADVADTDDLNTATALRGDFFGASVALDGLTEAARSLFIEADDAGGDAAQAVADAARAIVDFRAAYGHLAEWESHDIALPVGRPGGTEASTFADELFGRAVIGVDLLERAHERRLGAYTLLRDAEASSDEAKAHFEVQYRAEVDFFAEALPRIRRVVGDETTQELVTVDRFESPSPTGQARARSMTVVCIDREAYAAARAALAGAFGLGATTDGDLPEVLAGLPGIPASDCPDLPEATVEPAA